MTIGIFFDLTNRPKKYIVLSFLLAIIPSYILAQDNMDDTNSSSSVIAYENALNSYEKAIGRNSMIYTGPNYRYVHTGIAGHPYFIDNYWESGTISYEGQCYDSIEIKYDIIRDLLIVKHLGMDGYLVPLELYSPKVEEFNLLGHHFLYIKEDILSDFNSGFYDLLYDGDTVEVLAKRIKKETKGQNSISKLEKRYVQKDKYYLKYKSKYYPVKGKKSYLKVLSDKKSELKTFIRNNKSRFRNEYEKQLVEVVRYYNSILTNEGS